MRSIAPADRLRAGRLAALCLVVLIAVAACGGTAAGGGGGGGGATGADTVISETQAAIGTSMIGGTVDGTTITITLIDGFGEGGAKLFMCSQVTKSLAANDPTGTLTVVMVEKSGTQLASSADC